MGCNNVNGLCDYGCSPGWKGHDCNIGIGNNYIIVQFFKSCLIIGLLYNYVNLIQKKANKLSISWGFFYHLLILTFFKSYFINGMCWGFNICPQLVIKIRMDSNALKHVDTVGTRGSVSTSTVPVWMDAMLVIREACVKQVSSWFIRQGHRVKRNITWVRLKHKSVC